MDKWQISVSAESGRLNVVYKGETIASPPYDRWGKVLDSLQRNARDAGATIEISYDESVPEGCRL